MKNKLLIFGISILFGVQINAQNTSDWSSQTSSVTNKKLHRNTERNNFPDSYVLMNLDLNSFKNKLSNAPSRNNASKSNVVIALPNTKKQLEKYQIFEASNFDEELQASFPEIRSYVGIGIDDPKAVLRLSVDPNGIQGMIFRTDKKNEFIEPYSADGKTYAVFNSERIKGKLPFTCSTEDQNYSVELSKTISTTKSSTGVLRTFRLALSCTAEYANYFNATSAANVGLVLAAFNATMTRVNGVFEKDFAMHFNIVSESQNVIFYNAATDPYSDAATGASGAWNTELQNTLSSRLTGVGTSLSANNAAYDIGHLFGASGGGGNAGCIGCICTNDTASQSDKNKGSGYTSPADNNPQGDYFDIDYVAHEIGHQVGANHTFSMSSEGTGVNMEVGSGSTIMGYAGITDQDVQAHSDDYFHAASINQVQTNISSKTCGSSTNITHGAPVVEAGANYTIPKSTPFMLTGSATDTGGTSTMTYCWEQYDNTTTTGAASAASPTKTTGPNFKSYSPTASPTRYLPNLTSVFNGSTTTAGAEIDVEALSSVARTLNFRLTARDNVVSPAGQTGFDNMTVTVSGTTGPLTVTSQGTTNVVWTPGNTETITWTVNNTNTLPGGTNVDILYTTDEGATWTTILANTPNDGSQAITVPSVTEPKCRIMVKASGNIFFNVNTKNIAIGNYVYENQNVCIDYTFDLNANFTEDSSTSYSGISLPINDVHTITDVNFYANITHPSIGEVNMLIRAPWQTALNTAIWYNNTSCTNANMDKWFDTAGSAVNCAATNGGTPFTPFSVTNINGYNGNPSNGSWAIFFKDAVVNSNISNAKFNTFKIQICHSEQVAVLSNNSFEIDGLSVYPNPNNGTFSVEFSPESNKVNVTVHDIRGRQILTNEYQASGLFNESINIKNAQSGIYLVTITDGNKKSTKKIVVQ